MIDLSKITPQIIERLPFKQKQELLHWLREARIINARQDFLSFIKYNKADYLDEWYHRYVAYKLQQVVEGEITRLILVLPPQHGKSEQASRMLPAFAYGRNISERIMACSYSDALTSLNNTAVQRIMSLDTYRELFPKVYLPGKGAIAADNTRVKRNTTEFDVLRKIDDRSFKQEGSYYCAGVQGGISGRPFTLGIIDDYIRGAKEAQSPVVREALINWYISEFTARQAPNARIIIMATRWDENDLIGYVLAKAKEDPTADQWEVVVIPAERVKDDEYDASEIAEYDAREYGEFLWESYYGHDFYTSQKASWTTYWWSAMYMGAPTAPEGNVIKRAWFEPYIYRFDLDDVVGAELYWDLGGSDSKDADRTVGTVGVQLASGEVIKLWQYAGQWSPKTRDEEIEQFAVRWAEIFPELRVDVEAQIGVGVQAVTDIKNRLLAKGLNCHVDKVTKSKYLRASDQKDSYFAAAESKRVKLYAGSQFKDYGFNGEAQADWIREFFAEVTRLVYKNTSSGTEFAGGKDDRLDSSVGMYNKLTKDPQFFGVVT